MSKIAQADADVMNHLFASEVARLGGKEAGAHDTKEEGPTPSDAQAFKDHEEYIELLDNVMADDARDGFDPNDPSLD